ncbi:hypothetical protein ACE3NQ_16615 [Paenibacillus terreus]|uniref:Sporulation protein YjcZ n=1 Tax=Paenibacillus terreus TaxID=1387834 RepID=A0ABV5BA21_9BACL
MKTKGVGYAGAGPWGYPGYVPGIKPGFGFGYGEWGPVGTILVLLILLAIISRAWLLY